MGIVTDLQPTDQAIHDLTMHVYWSYAFLERSGAGVSAAQTVLHVSISTLFAGSAYGVLCVPDHNPDQRCSLSVAIPIPFQV